MPPSRAVAWRTASSHWDASCSSSGIGTIRPGWRAAVSRSVTVLRAVTATSCPAAAAASARARPRPDEHPVTSQRCPMRPPGVWCRRRFSSGVPRRPRPGSRAHDGVAGHGGPCPCGGARAHGRGVARRVGCAERPVPRLRPSSPSCPGSGPSSRSCRPATRRRSPCTAAGPEEEGASRRRVTPRCRVGSSVLGRRSAAASPRSPGREDPTAQVRCPMVFRIQSAWAGAPARGPGPAGHAAPGTPGPEAPPTAAPRGRHPGEEAGGRPVRPHAETERSYEEGVLPDARSTHRPRCHRSPHHRRAATVPVSRSGPTANRHPYPARADRPG